MSTNYAEYCNYSEYCNCMLSTVTMVSFCTTSIVGTKVVPCDFIAPVETHNPISGGIHHEVYVIDARN